MTVDPALVRAAEAAVSAGRAKTLSGWVNLALAERAEKDSKLDRLGEVIAAYEAEYGVITDAELEARRRADKRAAIRPKRRRSA